MSYLGRFGIGDSVPLSISVTNELEVPSDPDAAPKASIYDQAGSLLASSNLPYSDRPSHTFSERFLLNSSYSSSADVKYNIVYNWDVSGTAQQAADSFELVKYASGQNTGGSILALRTLNRPGGKWIVHQTEDGEVRAGYRPYIP